MNDLSRIRFVTGNFLQLQGLRIVPIGLFLLFIGADSRGWLNWLPGKPSGPADIGNAWSLGAWCAATIAAVAATAYYRQQYGVVNQFDRRGRDRLLMVAIIAFIQGAAIDWTRELPILLGPLVISGALVVTVVLDGCLRIHYLMGAAGWLVLSIASVVGNETSPLTLGHYFLVGGLTLIICGTGDHLLLVKTLTGFTETGQPSFDNGRVDA